MRYVLIEARGGVVQEVYTDDAELEVFLLDHDEGDEPVPFPADTDEGRSLKEAIFKTR